MEAAARAFLIAGARLLATGLIPALERLVQCIPGPVVAAMLAGVLFSFVAQAFLTVPGAELSVLPLLALYFAVRLLSPIWAVLGVLVAGAAWAMALGLVWRHGRRGGFGAGGGYFRDHRLRAWHDGDRRGLLGACGGIDPDGAGRAAPIGPMLGRRGLSDPACATLRAKTLLAHAPTPP